MWSLSCLAFWVSFLSSVFLCSIHSNTTNICWVPTAFQALHHEIIAISWGMTLVWLSVFNQLKKLRPVRSFIKYLLIFIVYKGASSVFMRGIKYIDTVPDSRFLTSAWQDVRDVYSSWRCKVVCISAIAVRRECAKWSGNVYKELMYEPGLRQLC